jgi:hypothetical protein
VAGPRRIYTGFPVMPLMGTQGERSSYHARAWRDSASVSKQ